MVTQWKKYIFKINEFYGNNEAYADLKKADVNAYFYQSKPVKSNKRFSIHRQALHFCMDISKSEEVLLKEMNKKTRYKIRRAKRDNLTVTYIEHPEINDVKAFARFYNAFAKEKGIEDCKLEKLVALMENNMLFISYVSHADGRILSYSTIISTNGSAIGLFNASGRFFYKDISGQIISRANRYLHWCGMMYFKQLGYHTFNMMGLTTDANNIDHQKINEFKRSFGGEDRTIYQSFIPQNLLGTFLILVLKILWRNNPEIMRNEQSAIVECSESQKGHI